MRVILNNLEVGRTYRHFKNPRFVIKVMDRFESSRGECLILQHDLVDELQVCLTKSYTRSQWVEIKA